MGGSGMLPPAKPGGGVGTDRIGKGLSARWCAEVQSTSLHLVGGASHKPWPAVDIGH